MSDNTYNGWTNYATWRVNLEMFDGGDWRNTSAECFREAAHDLIEQQAEGLALDYARTFLQDVDWHEIARHYQDDESEESDNE